MCLAGGHRSDLCVPKSSSALISWRNHLTSAHNVRAVLLLPFGFGLAIQVKKPARGRECGASTSVDRFAAQGAGPGPADEQRPLVFDPGVSMVSVDPAGRHNRSACDARAMASGRLSLLLALEITPTGRATADRDGPPRTDPADEYREPALGSAAHSRRTAQARV
jgi:hypothetical protein